jgi:N-methylhydantoinase A/oxoprolinase/acetone carboxylase beta subunit
MMPKMLETANMTEQAIRESGVKAPLMVMRSDGGIMDINEMRRRPILTMLSGPAAGVAAALMYEKVSDGIFLEVGGTSTDISVIKNGKPQVKSAQIGGNRLYLRTLDVRTLGTAGGSVPRFHKNKIIDVGPRSAHIAQLNYVAFADEDFSDIEIEQVQPLQNDPNDYLAIKTKSSQNKFTVTPTEASYQLELVKEQGHSAGNLESIKKCFSSLSKNFNKPSEEIAEEILKISAEKIKPIIDQLIREYKLDKELVELFGGGGGASAIVPFTSKYLNYPHRIAKDCEVISAIGAALGMIRDSVEKTIINPTENDIIELRQQAFESVVKMGANPDSIEVSIEIDTTNKKVIAVAMGSSEMRSKEIVKNILSDDELLEIASKSLRAEKKNVNVFFQSDFLSVFNYEKIHKHLLGLIKEHLNSFRVIDKEGTIKLQLQNAKGLKVKVNEVKASISKIISELTSFGDAGALVPDIFIIASSRIIDFTGLINETQIISLAEFELSKIPQDETVVILASQKK